MDPTFPTWDPTYPTRDPAYPAWDPNFYFTWVAVSFSYTKYLVQEYKLLAG